METLPHQSPFVDLTRFIKLRNTVQAALADLSNAAIELEAVKMSDRLVRASRQLSEERFRLVVVGEFSNGKSTLINALLGSRVLPSFNRPTTPLVTVISQGSEPKYVLHFKDGTISPITLERFQDVVAPREPDPTDPDDEARYNDEVAWLTTLDLIQVQYPTQLCSHGVEIVDTPGTNDLDAARERITYEFIPKADAIIFVLSARQILSASEMQFFTGRVLKSDIGRVFFAINFKDFADTPDKQRKIVDHAIEHLSRVVTKPRVHLVCARDALAHRSPAKRAGTPMSLEDTGIPELEQAIVHFLQHTRFSDKLARPVQVGTAVASDLLAGPLKIRRSAIGLSVDQITEKLAAITPELDLVKAEHSQVLDSLRTHLAEAGEQVQVDLKRGLESVVTIGVAAARDYQGDLTKEKIAEAIEKAIGRKHTEQIERAKDGQQNALRENCLRAQQRMRTAWEKLTVKIDAEFIGPIPDIDVIIPDVVSDDDIMAASVGTGIGTVVLVALAHIFFPIAIVAGVLALFGLGDYLDKERRRKVLDEVVPQVRKRLSDGITPTVEAFATAWQRSASEACLVFDAEFSGRIEALSNEMKAIRRRLRHENRNASVRHAECDKIQAQIDRSVAILRECRWA